MSLYFCETYSTLSCPFLKNEAKLYKEKESQAM